MTVAVPEHDAWLLRHGATEWSVDGRHTSRTDLPLTEHGRDQAEAVGRALDGRSFARVLVSPRRRARETCERVGPALGTAPVRYEAGLYGASATSLLERLRGLPDDVGSVLIIGHNPAIAELAVTLARPSPRRRDLELKFPTGALATLTGPLPSWRGLDHDSAELVAFVRPRDLER